LVALGAGALAAAGFAVGAAGAAGVAGVPLGSTGVSDRPEPVAGAAGASEAAGESVAGESEAPALLQAHTLSVHHAQGQKGVPTGVSQSPEPMVGAIEHSKVLGSHGREIRRASPVAGTGAENRGMSSPPSNTVKATYFRSRFDVYLMQNLFCSMPSVRIGTAHQPYFVGDLALDFEGAASELVG